MIPDEHCVVDGLDEGGYCTTTEFSNRHVLIKQVTFDLKTFPYTQVK